MSDAAGSPQARTLWNKLGLIAGPVLALATYLALAGDAKLGNGSQEGKTAAVAAVTTWMAVWWITEAIPLAATALLPVVLLPALRVQTTAIVAGNYAGDLIFLFLGGFLVALAIEESGLHKRVALTIVAAMGDHPRRIVFGFMLATAVLSMWLSNSATTMMLLPIAVSVLRQADRQVSGKPTSADGSLRRNFGVTLMLGTAYGASLGGVGTIVGTPPNAYFRGYFADEFISRGAPDFSFGAWMAMAIPMSAVFLVLAWWLLVRFVFPLADRPMFGGGNVIKDELRGLGPMSRDEKAMAVIFAATALLWILREPVAGWGWAPLLQLGRQEVGGKSIVWFSDGAVAILMGLVCFVVPSKDRAGRGILEWKSTARLPWEVLLLFGGGMALAAAMDESGFATFAGQELSGAIGQLSAWSQVAVCSTAMTFQTEMTSNLASVQIAMPILKEAAQANGRDPRLLMLPTTLAASWAFMLPVATPPNAIVYGSGRVAIRDMVKAGVIMNLIGIGLIVIVTFAVAVPMFGIDTQGAPEWSVPVETSPEEQAAEQKIPDKQASTDQAPVQQVPEKQAPQKP